MFKVDGTAKIKKPSNKYWAFRIWRPYGDSNPGYRRESAGDMHSREG